MKCPGSCLASQVQLPSKESQVLKIWLCFAAASLPQKTNADFRYDFQRSGRISGPLARAILLLQIPRLLDPSRTPSTSPFTTNILCGFADASRSPITAGIRVQTSALRRSRRGPRDDLCSLFSPKRRTSPPVDRQSCSSSFPRTSARVQPKRCRCTSAIASSFSVMDGHRAECREQDRGWGGRCRA